MAIKIFDFNIIGDERGNLISLESSKNIPFEIKRVYYIFGTNKDVIRGNHAHKNLEQIMICVKGSCTVCLDDGKNKQTIFLDQPNKGVYVKDLIWRTMYEFSDDCVMMVLASKHYDEQDYIRNYEEFLKIVAEMRAYNE